MSRRLALIAAGSVALVAVAMAPVGLALAAPQPAPGTLVIRSVDSRTYATDGKVTMVLEADGQGTAGGFVTINGVPAKDLKLVNAGNAGSTDPAKAGQAAVPTGIVFVVDTSKAMGDINALPKLIDALTKTAQLRQPNQQLALVSYGVQRQVVSDFTTDPAAFAAAAATLSPSTRDDAAPWDGLSAALGLFDQHPDMQRNVVFVSAAADSVSSSSFLGVRGDVLNNGVEFSAVSLAPPKVDAQPLASLAADSGGRFAALTTPDGIAGAINTDFLRISNQRLVTAVGPLGAQTLDINVTLGPLSSSAHVMTGSAVAGSALTPKVILASAKDTSLLHGKSVKLISLLLILLAVLLFAVTLGTMLVRENNGLDAALSHYGEDTAPLDTFEGDHVNSNMVQSKLMNRAVEFTSEMASRRGLLQWVERSLELSDLPLRAGEALFVYLAAAFLVAAATLVLVGNLMATLLLAGVVIAIPPMLLKTICARRRTKFIAQLPDMLTLLASTLKAGYSLMQGVEAVSEEVSDPMGKELRRIVVESRLGRPLEDAMEDAASRMASLDFSWAVMAISIQREVGGNLAELLLTVAETMTERERLRRDVKSLTAEGRMSAIVLGCLPPGLGAVMYSINPAYIKVLFNDPTGQKLLGLAVVMIIAGILWMRKMVQVDV